MYFIDDDAYDDEENFFVQGNLHTIHRIKQKCMSFKPSTAHSITGNVSNHSKAKRSEFEWMEPKVKYIVNSS